MSLRASATRMDAPSIAPAVPASSPRESGTPRASATAASTTGVALTKSSACGSDVVCVDATQRPK